MYCPKCYRLNEDGAEFCSSCGHRFEKKETKAETVPSQQIKYCSHCGNKLLAEAVICPQCGCSAKSPAHAEDKPSVPLILLSFFIPIAGLVMFLVYYQDYPRKAKTIGIAALVSFIINVIFTVIFRIF